jgi:hypothetical protein
MTESCGIWVCGVSWLDRRHDGSGHAESVGSHGLQRVRMGSIPRGRTGVGSGARLIRSVDRLPGPGDGPMGPPPRVMNSVYIYIWNRILYFIYNHNLQPEISEYVLFEKDNLAIDLARNSPLNATLVNLDSEFLLQCQMRCLLEPQ